MLKFYVDSLIQHPLTGEPDHKIIEVIADVPELEKALFEDRRSKGCTEERTILDVARVRAERSGEDERQL